MYATHRDKAKIQDLHAASSGSGLPINSRNASQSTWKNPPTPIATPGQARSVPHYNPFNRAGSGKTRAGNLTAQSTPATHWNESQSRAQSSKYYSLGSNGTFTKGEPSRPRKRHKRNHPVTTEHRSQAVMVLEDDESEEDVGQPVCRKSPSSGSPDPIDSITLPHPAAKLTKHPGQSLPAGMPEKPPPRKGALRQNGEATERMAAVIGGREQGQSAAPLDVDDSDSIQSDSHFSTPQIDADKPERTVRTPSRRTEFPSVEGKIKMYDLKEKMLQSKRSQTVISSMKPRLTKPKLKYETLQTDPIATASTNYTTSTTSSKPISRKKPPIQLPLAAWIVGFKKSSPKTLSDSNRYCLLWDEAAKELAIQDTLSSHKVLFSLKLSKSTLKKVTVTDDKIPTPNPVIKLELSSSLKTSGPLASEFNPGERQQNVVWQFITQNGDPAVYTRLSKALRDHCDPDKVEFITGPTAAGALWGEAENISVSKDDEGRPANTASKGSSSKQVVTPRPPNQSRQAGNQSTNKAAVEFPSRRRSTRLSGQEEMAAALPPVSDADEVILVYPLTGPGAVNITNAELGRLRPGEFLNDTLIEFGLKLWLNELRDSQPELADQIHVFSSFFYKKISTKNAEEGYHSVRKWTSKIDLFQKKYVVVPINEHLHWYLAIICNPGYVLNPPPPKTDAPPVRRSARKSAAETEASRIPSLSTGLTDSLRSSEVHDLTMDRSRSPSCVPPSVSSEGDDENAVEDMISRPKADRKAEDSSISGVATQPKSAADLACHDDLDGEHGGLKYPSSPIDQNEATDSDAFERRTHEPEPKGDAISKPTTSSGIPVATFYGKGKQKAQSSNGDVAVLDTKISPEPISISDTEENIQEHPRTQIYTFDSLSSKHPQAIKRLGHYLQMEAADKKGIPIEETTPPQGRQALVPMQDNFCDCGVYLLHFAKSFMNNPELSINVIESQKASPLKRKRTRAAPHEHWDGPSIEGLRVELDARIQSLSELWKKMRAEREELKKSAERETSGDKATPVVSGHDSDSDIVMEEPEPKPVERPHATRAQRIR